MLWTHALQIHSFKADAILKCARQKRLNCVTVGANLREIWLHRNDRRVENYIIKETILLKRAPIKLAYPLKCAYSEEGALDERVLLEVGTRVELCAARIWQSC